MCVCVGKPGPLLPHPWVSQAQGEREGEGRARGEGGRGKKRYTARLETAFTLSKTNHMEPHTHTSQTHSPLHTLPGTLYTLQTPYPHPTRKQNGLNQPEITHNTASYAATPLPGVWENKVTFLHFWEVIRYLPHPATFVEALEGWGSRGSAGRVTGMKGNG